MTFTEIGNLYGGDPFYVYWKSGILDDVSESTMDTLVDALLDDQLQINNEANVIQVWFNSTRLNRICMKRCDMLY